MSAAAAGRADSLRPLPPEVRLGGFEPPTHGLEGRRSSTELQARAPKRTAGIWMFPGSFRWARLGESNSMGIILSLIVMAVGAILTWGVNSSGGSVDVDVVGVVLMGVGVILFLISLVLWRTWWGAGFWGWGPEPYAGGAGLRRRADWPTRRRATYG